MEKIGFFSSDAASLYKKDVFRIMGLQEGFVIHFRYGLEHLSFPLADLKKSIGQSAYIIFTQDNDLAIPIDTRVVKNIPLREAIIQDIMEAPDTGLVHVYLKLSKFKSCDFQFKNPSDKTPYKWVSILTISKEEDRLWYEQVKAIKGKFPNQLFYKIDIFDKTHSNIIVPKVDEHLPYYPLSDEESYLLDISFYDTSDIHKDDAQRLEVKTDGKDSLEINSPEIIDVGARRDNRRYHIYTQALTSKNSFSYINFKTTNNNTTGNSNLENDIQLLFEISKNKGRAVAFTIYTLLAGLSVGLGKLISDKWALFGSFNLGLFAYSILALGVGGFAFYKLYELFNKK